MKTGLTNRFFCRKTQKKPAAPPWDGDQPSRFFLVNQSFRRPPHGPIFVPRAAGTLVSLERSHPWRAPAAPQPPLDASADTPAPPCGGPRPPPTLDVLKYPGPWSRTASLPYNRDYGGGNAATHGPGRMDRPSLPIIHSRRPCRSINSTASGQREYGRWENRPAARLRISMPDPFPCGPLPVS